MIGAEINTECPPQERDEDRLVRVKMVGYEETPDPSHPIMVVSFDDTHTKCCAHSWCTGGCSYPAAVIVGGIANKEHKLYGSMVACGSVVQSWRGEWTGEKLVVPTKYWQFLSRRIWL